jgi:hypothetical protein
MDSEFKSSVKWETSIFISTKELINQYKGFNRNADRYTPVQTNTINSALDKLCPSAAKTRPSINGIQIRGLELPTIQIARREFEKYMGSKLEWDQDSVSEELVKEPKLTKHNTFNEA